MNNLINMYTKGDWAHFSLDSLSRSESHPGRECDNGIYSDALERYMCLNIDPWMTISRSEESQDYFLNK